MLTEESRFIEGDLLWLESSNITILLPGWQESEGAMMESKRAKFEDIPRLEALHELNENLWKHLESDAIFSIDDMALISDSKLKL